jgi:hypothetical protein
MLRHLTVAALILGTPLMADCTGTVVGGGVGGGTSGSGTTTGTGTSTTGATGATGTTTGTGTSTGGTTTGTTSSTSATTGTTSTTGSGGMTACPSMPAGPSISVFSLANAQGGWSDPTTGLAGTLFLEPASAGGFKPSSSGTTFDYMQLNDDASFGVWFAHCVNASSFSGVTFQVWPLSAPAGSRAILHVQTASTTPPPHGTCTAGAGCVAPSFTFGYAQFGLKTPYTVTWSQLSGAQPAEQGSAISGEIVGLRWVIDAFVGPPPQPAMIYVMAANLAFTP